MSSFFVGRKKTRFFGYQRNTFFDVERILKEKKQLGKFCTKKWSKETLGLYYPLFKIYDDSLPIEEQVKDHRDNNRYYGKIYSFGNGEQKLLITSEWYKESKEKYIRWFNSLVK